LLMIIHQLNRTFQGILSKSGAFSFSTTPRSNEAASSAGAEALEWFSSASVLHALCFVMDTFKGVLDSIKPAAFKDGATRNHYRTALLGLTVSTGLTMEQYRKKLDHSLAQIQAQLSGLGQSEGLLPPPKSVMPMIPVLPDQKAPKAMPTIEEDSEAEGSESSSSSSSKARAIVGGVLGAAGRIAILPILPWYIHRRRQRAPAPFMTDAPHIAEAFGEPVPYPLSLSPPPKYYDPSDPSTFPNFPEQHTYSVTPSPPSTPTQVFSGLPEI